MMNEVGYSLEDARNYGCIGCQEIVGSGNDYPMPNGAYPPHATLYWAAIFDMAMNDGLNPLNGVQASMHTGYLYEMESIEDVREAVKKQATHILKLNPENYYVSFVPVDIDPGMILMADAVSFAAIMLLLLIPCLFISKVDPARTVRVR